MHSSFCRKTAGFTLIELLIVLAIIALLLTLAVPRYFGGLDHSKETLLKENLRVTRDSIDKFYGDTGRYPEGLDELVRQRYLRSLPMDPITESTATWIIIAPTNGLKGNVYDLKSGAQGFAKDNRPFSSF